MRIPIAESDIGVWYPIGKYYMFISKKTSWYTNNGNIRYEKFRESTYSDFKKEFPFIYSGQLRCKNKVK